MVFYSTIVIQTKHRTYLFFNHQFNLSLTEHCFSEYVKDLRSLSALSFWTLRRRSHLVPGHCAQAPVRNCALLGLRCPVLNACSHSVPNTLSGH